MQGEVFVNERGVISGGGVTPLASTAVGPGAGLGLKVLDIVESVAVNWVDNQAGYNVRHWQVIGIAGTGPTLGDVATTLETLLSPKYQGLMNVKAQHIGVKVRKVAPLPVSAAAWDTSGTIFGGVQGELLPKQTAGLISWSTQLGGRAGRGRTYAPFPGEASSDANSYPVQGYLDALTALAAIYFSQITTSGINNGAILPVIFHKKTLAATPIQGYVRRVRWATQRRRGDFGRPNPFPALTAPA